MPCVPVLIFLKGANCLRGVSLEVDPDVVQRGEKVILRCNYDLENAPLYSLKWYRGRHEFYRFSPTEESSTKTFNISGINVDPDKSNNSQVTLRNVDFGLSGTFICEVTADAPTFSTASASKNLTVVFLPREEPVIVSERDRYDPGDMLRANCSLPPSKPPVHISFTLNSMPPPGAPNEILITTIRAKMLSSNFCRAKRRGTGTASGDALPIISGDDVARISLADTAKCKMKVQSRLDRGAHCIHIYTGIIPRPSIPADYRPITPRKTIAERGSSFRDKYTRNRGKASLSEYVAGVRLNDAHEFKTGWKIPKIMFYWPTIKYAHYNFRIVRRRLTLHNGCCFNIETHVSLCDKRDHLNYCEEVTFSFDLL
ncbi:hypothetical protein ALC53_01298 [Atta colombica]|uniref:Ig-like domain-containing protein n=1 Tax=Atta colombica TaxID=520822 RepID=A0A195BVE6_9HYME|nr:hypothetical protein ALC53_01298 [Atta colombica]